MLDNLYNKNILLFTQTVCTNSSLDQQVTLVNEYYLDMYLHISHKEIGR